MKTLTNILGGAVLACGLAYADFASAQQAAFSTEIEVLSLDDMQELSGGDGGGVSVAVITEQTLNATNSGNSVIGDTVGSGQVTIGSGAFSGYSGLGNFVINTGHNNNLQSTMNVSVVVTPETP